MPDKIRIAQIGTKHGHATGKLVSLLAHPEVEFAGLWEPDATQRQQLQQNNELYRDVAWVNSEADILDDPTIVAVASEGSNAESLDQTEAIVAAGKHVWYDKPAGENWPQWQRVVAMAQEKQLLIQMGYMFRYHDGFRKIGDWVHSGMLGNVFSVRAHMSTGITLQQQQKLAQHQGGIFYDLGGHMLDQVLWLLGRPSNITSFFHNDGGQVAGLTDNSMVVFEFDKALALIDIAAMETKPMARRFEVYGTKGSAILLEPFEPGTNIRLCLDEARDGFGEGEQLVPIDAQPRQSLYDIALDGFLATIRGDQERERSIEHDLLVQEVLLTATGAIGDVADGVK